MRYKTSKKPSLAETFPEIAAEWDCLRNGALTPKNVLPGSDKFVHWKCKRGHKWIATVGERTRRNSPCPYCSGRRVLVGENDLQTLFPEVAAQWDTEANGDLSPQKVSAKSNKKVHWICEEGHKWEARIADRTRTDRKPSACPYCNGKFPILGETDLATKFPEVAAQWDAEKNEGLSPDQVTAYSTKKVWWHCAEGHSWAAIIGNRTRHHSGCPFCEGKRPIVGVNDLATTHPKLAYEWHPTKNQDLQPEDFMAHSKRVVWWQCRDGHEWQAPIVNRAVHLVGCPYDMGKMPIPGVNDLFTRFPELVREWDFERNRNLDPSQLTPGSNRKAWWKCCDCGYSWKAAIYKRSAGSQCPHCVKVRGKGR